MIGRDKHRALRERMMADGWTEDEARKAIDGVLAAFRPTLDARRTIDLPGVGILGATVVKPPKGKHFGPSATLHHRYEKAALRHGETIFVGERP